GLARRGGKLGERATPLRQGLRLGHDPRCAGPLTGRGAGHLGQETRSGRRHERRDGTTSRRPTLGRDLVKELLEPQVEQGHAGILSPREPRTGYFALKRILKASTTAGSRS